MAQRTTQPLFREDPVLTEVTPNAANIYQYHEHPDADLEFYEMGLVIRYLRHSQ